MDCPPGQEKVAVIERWPLVEVLLSALYSLSVFSLAKSLSTNQHNLQIT